MTEESQVHIALRARHSGFGHHEPGRENWGLTNNYPCQKNLSESVDSPATLLNSEHKWQRLEVRRGRKRNIPKFRLIFLY